MTNTRASELQELQSYTELSELRIEVRKCSKHRKTPQNTVLFEIL